MPLMAAEGKAVLDELYPTGWKWDFYLVSGGRSRRGMWALPGLTRVLGVRNVLSLMRDYAVSYVRAGSSPRCGVAAVNPESRRAAIKAALLLPFFTGLSRLPISTRPSAPSRGGSKLVHIARISNSASIDVEQCDACVEQEISPGIALPKEASAPPTPTPVVKRSFEQRSREPLLDRTAALFPSEDPVRIVLERVSYELVRHDATGPVSEADLSLFSGGVVDPAFNLSLTVADDGATSIGGICRHNVPGFTIDYLVWTGPAASSGTIAAGYGAALRRLATVHSGAGRVDLGTSYERMAAALTQLSAHLDELVPVAFAPLRNELIVTSMPDLMRSVSLPDDLPIPRRPQAGTQSTLAALPPSGEDDVIGGPYVAPEPPRGTDFACSFGCSCDCFASACLSCGCGFQFCVPAVPICSCGTCFSVFGCSCGICCWGSCNMGKDV